jgi:hypothetical protein
LLTLEEYVDMIKVSIIDQVKVIRTALPFQVKYVFVVQKNDKLLSVSDGYLGRREAVLCEKDLSGDAGKKGGSAGQAVPSRRREEEGEHCYRFKYMCCCGMNMYAKFEYMCATV